MGTGCCTLEIYPLDSGSPGPGVIKEILALATIPLSSIDVLTLHTHQQQLVVGVCQREPRPSAWYAAIVASLFRSGAGLLVHIKHDNSAADTTALMIPYTPASCMLLSIRAEISALPQSGLSQQAAPAPCHCRRFKHQLSSVLERFPLPSFAESPLRADEHSYLQQCLLSSVARISLSNQVDFN